MTRSATTKPKILLTTTTRYYPAARLVMALAAAGCEVDAVCPSAHPLRKTSAVSRAHAYHGLAPLNSFACAIGASKPDLIVSADDLATEHLHRLHTREKQPGQATPLSALIERSLGKAKNFSVVRERAAFIAAAREQGIRGPLTAAIENLDELRRWIRQNGLPAVLKADGSSGGDGVCVARTLAEAEAAFVKLQSPPLLARALKRTLLDDDQALLVPSLLRHRPMVNVQNFVAGHEATSTIFCWQGEVLASLHFEVLQKASANGHATVLGHIDHPEMSSAVETVTKTLGFSGFFGFDFMLESGSGHAHLIEVNARATQVGHLTMGAGHDLPAALFAAVSGESIQPSPRINEKETVALFPQEWIRDPESPYLRSAYHDVPWQEPALIADCVSNRARQSAWYSRAKRKQVRANEKSMAIPARSIANKIITKTRAAGIE
jgi:hypothetical protein